MKKYLKRLMTLLLCLVILCSGLGIVSSAEKSDSSKEGSSVTALTDYKATEKEKKAIKSGFTPVLKGEGLTLYYKEKTAEVAVYSAQNDEIVYSNPQNIPKTVKGLPLHKIKSQLYITYYQENNQVKYYSSSFDALGRDQVTAEVVDNNLKVNYIFGKKKIIKEMLPVAIPKEKFEEKVLPKISGEDLNLIKKQYKLISADDSLSDLTREKYEKNYKNFKSTDLYILNTYIASFDVEPVYDILYSTDYTQKDFEEDNKASGNDTKIEDTNVVFELALIYSLKEGALQVELDCSKLKVLDNANIHSVDILQYFGCASKKEKGYFLVPSGSGGLVSFNSSKSSAGAYKEYVYGYDSTIRVNNLNSKDIQVQLPVFGISNTTKNNGMLVVAEKSAEYLTVNADIARSTVPYNCAYFSAVVYPFDEMTVNNPISGGGTTQIYTHQKAPLKDKVTLSYNFLNKGKNTYSDMANLYREMLVSEGVLTEKVSGEQPFVYSLLGGIDVKKHFMGIPYTGMQSLTTFEQAEEIIDSLSKEGIDNQYVKYLNWFNGGAKQKLADRIKVLSCLGGKKGLKNLFETEKAHIYPNVSFTAVTNSLFDGFSVRKDAARLTYNESALIYELSIPKNFFDYESDYTYVVSPWRYDSVITKFLSKYSYGNLSIDGLASQINSDFDEQKYAERTKSLELTEAAIAKLSGDKSIMASAPNKYATKYVDLMTDMPVSTSGANIIDTEVPFLQMVYSGYKDMSCSPINLSYGDYSLAKLLSFATAPSFAFGYEKSSVIMDTGYTEYYSFCFDDWKQDAVELYKAYNEVTSKVRGESITSHKLLKNGLCELTYENGTVIYINDTNKDIVYKGKTVKSDYYICEEG